MGVWCTERPFSSLRSPRPETTAPEGSSHLEPCPGPRVVPPSVFVRKLWGGGASERPASSPGSHPSCSRSCSSGSGVLVLLCRARAPKSRGLRSSPYFAPLPALGPRASELKSPNLSLQVSQVGYSHPSSEAAARV